MWPSLPRAAPSWMCRWHGVGRLLSSADSQWLPGLPSASPGREALLPVTCVSPRGCVQSWPLTVWFSHSVQHQGRLSLDLSHRACSDYSEMRASHGSNSLPSSARLGNCATQPCHSGSSGLFVSTCGIMPASWWPLCGASPPGPRAALHRTVPWAVCCALRFPSGHAVVPGSPLAREPCSRP